MCSNALLWKIKIRINMKLIYAGLTFLMFISCKKEVKITSEGFEFEVIKEGTGPTPEPNDFVRYNFRVLNNEREIIQDFVQEDYPQVYSVKDSLNTKIISKAIKEILSTSKKGGNYLLKVPSDSLSETQAEKKSNNFLFYEVEVKEIFNKVQYYDFKKEVEFKRNAKIENLQEETKNVMQDFYSGKNNFKEISSGLKVKYLEEGNGPDLKIGDTYKIHYLGFLKDGKKIGDSYKISSGLINILGSGQIIDGWNLAFQNFRKGTKAYLFVPSNLAYGDQGNLPEVPGNSDLFFYIEIIDVRPGTHTE